ncbi:MAG: LCP family protein [Chloroflexota bacterium]
MTQPRAVDRPDRRPTTAAFLSFLFPGFGQAYNGQFVLAGVLALPVLLLLVAGVLVVASMGSGAMSRLLDIRLLLALIVLDMALLGWRMFAIFQAHARRARLSFRRWPTWITAILALITLTMHALPAYYAAKAIETLGIVALEGGGRLFDDREGRDVAIPEPSHQPEVSQGERVTILFVGIDYGPGRAHHLTDTMLVATLDPDSGQAAMISVPRDLYGVALPDGSQYNAKLNSLMSTASADPARYPLGGLGTLKATIGELLGTRIHYFAAIDLAGMRVVVDTIGGIDLTVERTVNDPTYYDVVTGRVGLYLPPGEHHMDGALALAYVRSRMGAGESDFTRAERQQQVLVAIAEKLTAGNLLTTLPGLLDAVRDNLTTDIPSARIGDLAAEAHEADLGSIKRIVLKPPEFVTPEPFSVFGYILHPNLDAIRDLGKRIFESPTVVTP